ncbi:retrovirus-related pol polyprotein from transposon TNT 1-94 [Tanacetum coccineum]
MDLCGLMRVASINRKKYILVIVDDYSRYTWTLFLRSKDETPEVLKDFLTMIQRNLQAPVISVRTDRGTEFLNKTLNAFFKEEGIEHQTSTPRTPEQNGVVERRNRTLVEAARTMLSASKLPLFFWAEAIATACYTQNRSIIILTHEKMAYHIINDRKPLIKHLYIFGCTCYLTRDGENLDKMKEKGDPCILVGYSTQSKGYRVYNKRTRLIVESIHLRFDEIKEMSETSVANDTSGLVPQRQKASDYDNPDPAPELQNVSPSADTTSSSPTDNSIQKDTLPSTHIQPTSEPTTPTNVHAEENNDNQAEFTNPFCTPVQENAESSSRNIVLLKWRKNIKDANGYSDRDKKLILSYMQEETSSVDGTTSWGNSLTNVLTRRRGMISKNHLLRARAWRLSEFLSHSCTQGLSNLSLDAKMTFLYGPLKEKIPPIPRAFLDAVHRRLRYSRKRLLEKFNFLGDMLVSGLSKKQDCTAQWSSIEAEYVGLSAVGLITEYQLAYMFTKALSEDRFQYLVRRIGKRCLTPAELEGRMPTKIELTLEQSQQGVSNDVLILRLSWKTCQGDSLNLPDHRIHKDRDGDASFQLESDSLPHAHAQTTKTYYKHQD